MPQTPTWLMAQGWILICLSLFMWRVQGWVPFAQPCFDDAVATWVWLAYDQLNVAFLESLDLDNLGVVLIESSHKAQRRPYHQQKLGVLLANQRHFALELQSQGIPVLYLLRHRTVRFLADLCRPAARALFSPC